MKYLNIQRVTTDSFETMSNGNISQIPASDSYWQSITHIIYECLSVSHSGTIKIFEGLKVLESPLTYISEIVKIKILHPHIKIILAFYKPCRRTGSTKCLTVPHLFLNSISQILQTYNFDGFEIDLELVTYIPNEFTNVILAYSAFKYNQNCFFRLSNEMKYEDYNTLSILKTMTELGAYLILNSSGYIPKLIYALDSGYYSQMIAGDQCKSEFVELIVAQLCPLINPKKIVINMPTKAYLYTAKSVGSVISNVTEIWHQSAICYDDYQTHQTLVLNPKNEPIRILSFDSNVNRINKLNFVKTYKLGGVAIDELTYDFTWKHPLGITYLIKQYLF